MDFFSDLQSIIQSVIIQPVRWTLIQLAGFQRLWQSQKLSDEDLRALASAIMQVWKGRNP
jgi:hypothetical protein